MPFKESCFLLMQNGNAAFWHDGCTGELLVDKSALALLVVIDLENMKSRWVFHFNPLGGSRLFFL